MLKFLWIVVLFCVCVLFGSCDRYAERRVYMSGDMKNKKMFVTHVGKPGINRWIIGFLTCLLFLNGCTRMPENGKNATGTPTPEVTRKITVTSKPTATPGVTPTQTPVPYQEKVSLKEAKKGCLVEFGAYEQDNNLKNGKEPIEWMVLDVKNGEALLLSKYALDVRSYHDETRPASWGASHLRKWLNGVFYEEAFTKKQQYYMEEHTQWTQTERLNDESFKPGTFDSVFLLELMMVAEGECFTEDETVKEFLEKNCKPCFKTKEEQIAYCTAYANAKNGGKAEVSPCTWLLRTPTGFDGEDYTVAGVSEDGTLLWDELHTDEDWFIRPVICVNIKSYAKDRETEEAGFFKVADDWEKVELSEAKAGTLVEFGSYEQDNDFTNGKEPIEWMVMKVEDGAALLLSRYGLDVQSYHTVSDRVSWEKSSIRKWLNYDFFDIAFDRAEQKKVIITSTNLNSRRPYSFTFVSDRVFLLGKEQLNSKTTGGYFSWNSQWNSSTMPTAYALARGIWPDEGGKCPWLLHNVNGEYHCTSWYVDESGNPVSGMDVTEAEALIRPAIWVSVTEGGFSGGEVTTNNPLGIYNKKIDWKPSSEVGELSPLSEAETGDLVEFGWFEQDRSTGNGSEPLLWKVTEVKNNKAKLESVFGIGSWPYHDRNEPVTWEGSHLRGFLNGEFIRNSFSDEEKKWLCADEEVLFQGIEKGERYADIEKVTDEIEVYPVLWVDLELVKEYEAQRKEAANYKPAGNGELVVGSGVVAYLNEDGILRFFEDERGFTENLDLTKTYQCITYGKSGIVWSWGDFETIDTEGVITRNANVIGLEKIKKFGQIRQISGRIYLLENGKVLDSNLDFYPMLEGAAYVVSGNDGVVAAQFADGRVVFSPSESDLLRNKKLSEWPTHLKQICAGDGFVGLLEDGTVMAENVVLNYLMNTVEQWSNIVAISAAEETIVGLKSDGTVVAVCTVATDNGQCNVDDWTDIVAIDTDGEVTVGLKADGSVVYSNNCTENE